MAKYNYDDFSSDNYNLNNFEGPDLGEKAPDFDLKNVENKTTRLLDFSGDFLVLELGSITCPLFQGRREGMDALVKEFNNASFTVLYVREAHPGKNIPAHKSEKDKEVCARRLNDNGEKRTILIDDLAGSAHSAYGNYPNAVFIINRNGCIVFRSDWNSVPATRSALTKLLKGQPAQTKSYFLPVKPSIAFKTLRNSGDGALQDFLAGLPALIWKNVIRRNFLLLVGSPKAVSPDSTC